MRIENFFKLMDIAEHHIEVKMKNLHENLTTFSKDSKNVEKIEDFFDYKSSTGIDSNNLIMPSKIHRKIKFFLNKIAKLEKLMINNLRKFLKNHSTEDLKELFNEPDKNIRSGARRNYIKTLKALFALSNAEIFQSKQFAKILKEQKNSIPLASDIKS